jgi:hypothetical protein
MVQTIIHPIPDGVNDFQSFRPHNGPGVDSDSIRNGYQIFSMGVKAAGS